MPSEPRMKSAQACGHQRLTIEQFKEATLFARRVCFPRKPTSAEKLAEIRKMYFEATPKTIQRDFDRAIDILKTLKDDEERAKAAVFMEGLNELRKEFKKK